MKLLILEALISVVYVFDVSTYPLTHVPFYFLTLLYFASMLEMYGMVKLVKFVSKRLSNGHRRAIARTLVGPFFTSSVRSS